MKKKFLLAIPIAIVIILAYYTISTEKNQPTKITPQTLPKRFTVIGIQGRAYYRSRVGRLSVHILPLVSPVQQGSFAA